MTGNAASARYVRAARAAAVLEERVDGDAHQPARPGWDCAACRQPWPCSPARVRLGEAYGGDRIGLAMYVGALLFAATAEIPTADPGDLYDRFVCWTR